MKILAKEKCEWFLVYRLSRFSPTISRIIPFSEAIVKILAEEIYMVFGFQVILNFESIKLKTKNQLQFSSAKILSGRLSKHPKFPKTQTPKNFQPNFSKPYLNLYSTSLPLIPCLIHNLSIYNHREKTNRIINLISDLELFWDFGKLGFWEILKVTQSSQQKNGNCKLLKPIFETLPTQPEKS